MKFFKISIMAGYVENILWQVLGFPQGFDLRSKALLAGTLEFSIHCSRVPCSPFPHYYLAPIQNSKTCNLDFFNMIRANSKKLEVKR